MKVNNLHHWTVTKLLRLPFQKKMLSVKDVTDKKVAQSLENSNMQEMEKRSRNGYCDLKKLGLLEAFSKNKL